jgi:hypothetical protein
LAQQERNAAEEKERQEALERQRKEEEARAEAERLERERIERYSCSAAFFFFTFIKGGKGTEKMQGEEGRGRAPAARERAFGRSREAERPPLLGKAASHSRFLHPREESFCRSTMPVPASFAYVRLKYLHLQEEIKLPPAPTSFPSAQCERSGTALNETIIEEESSMTEADLPRPSDAELPRIESNSEVPDTYRIFDHVDDFDHSRDSGFEDDTGTRAADRTA